MLSSLPFDLAACAASLRVNSLTRGLIGSALFNPFFVSWFTASRPCNGLTTEVDWIARRHVLTLIAGCVCLHALSSFQRTDRPERLSAGPPLPIATTSCHTVALRGTLLGY